MVTSYGTNNGYRAAAYRLQDVRSPSDPGFFRDLRAVGHVVPRDSDCRPGTPAPVRRRHPVLYRRNRAVWLHAAPGSAATGTRSVAQPRDPGTALFVAEYGPLFWAEKYVPSGIASVLEATLPLITMVLETLVFRRHRFHWRLLLRLRSASPESGRFFFPMETGTLRSCLVSQFSPARRLGLSARCSPARCHCRSPGS